jgi:ABC-type lipoprotein export system ATPase subunit
MGPSSTPDEAPAVLARDLTRIHRLHGHEVRSVDGVSLSIDSGEVVALVGPSGSGKTSLLHLLGGLDTPDDGTVSVRGNDWSTLGPDDRARFRRRMCGFVVQGESLLPQATAAENVEVPLLLEGVSADSRRHRTAEALRRVGLEEESGKLPGQLSVGQQQRVAIARAMVIEPTILLADEPTGSLDSHNAQGVIEVIVGATRTLATAVVVVTHSPEVSRRADRVLRLHSGKLAADGPSEVS